MTLAAGPAADRAGLSIEPVRSRRDLDEFIRVPSMLYDGARGFIAPLAMERRDALRADRNPYFAHGQAQYWLARRGARTVGRISAQIDSLYLERHDRETGHFGFIDAEDDVEVFRALFGAAESWLGERGMRRILGPYSLSSNEESGLLVDGFESTSMLMMGFAPPYADRHLGALGYRKAKDLVAYDLEVPRSSPPMAKRFADGLAETSRARVRPLDKRRYAAEMRTAIDIFNDAWSENWGFVPFTEAEMIHAVRSMRPLIRADLVWFGELDGEVVCMAVCLPNLNEALAGLNGALLPFGWLKLLWRLKVSGVSTGRVLLMGLRRRHQRSAIGTALVYGVLENLRQGMLNAGLRRVELSWVLEDNLPMRRIIESLGGRIYKTYRIFEKEIG